MSQSSKWTQSFSLANHAAVIFRAGSHAHGTYIPPDDPNGIDDSDYMIIVIPPLENLLSFDPFESAEFKEDSLDVVIYSWKKYLGLLYKSNPNVLGTLWLPTRDYYQPSTWNDPMGYLHRNRDVFATKAAYMPFIGYAKAQLHKMTHNAHLGYMGEKRKNLVEKYGYDTKNAAHLIRLMQMCIEFLQTGKMVVKRPNAEYIKSIKQGEWPLDEIQSEAEELFDLATQIFEESTLPERVDRKKVEAILLRGYDT